MPRYSKGAAGPAISLLTGKVYHAPRQVQAPDPDWLAKRSAERREDQLFNTLEKQARLDGGLTKEAKRFKKQRLLEGKRKNLYPACKKRRDRQQ